MKTSTILMLALALAPLTGCSEDEGDCEQADDCGDDSDAAVAGDLSYYRDVKPILDAKCTGCHTTGGIAPFTLLSYEDAKDAADAMREAVSTGYMPPWLAADGCSEYLGDRSLSTEQIDTIVGWIDQGLVAGNAADEGPPIDTGVQIQLSRVDRSLSMSEAYTAQLEPDDYHCFVMDWPESTTKYISGFRANPGNPQVVHHVIAFYATPANVAAVDALDAAEAGPGYTCFGGPGFDSNWLGAWAPGSLGSDFPAGTGLKIEPGSKVVIQVHYNSTTAGVASDQTSVDFKLDDSVVKEGWIQPWANPNWLNGQNMMIPANDADVEHSFQFDLTYVTQNKPIDIYSVGYHQHVLGSHGRVEIRRRPATGGGTECMVDVPRWDFHWQNAYAFATPKRFEVGDQLYLECHWDNSQEHQPIVNGQPQVSKDTWWGEGTTDEMCLTSFYLTLAD